jgi:hypothetical protein
VGITGRIALVSTALAGAAATALFAVAPAAQAGTGGSFIGKFKKLTTIGSTVPANGDVNPYGKGTKAAGGSVVNNGTVLRLVLLDGGSQPPGLINTTTTAPASRSGPTRRPW